MSFSSSSICVRCANHPSISLCEGCQRKFCLPCLSEHRNELSNELDDLFNKRNELVEFIGTQAPGNVTDKCSCFDEINRWQNEMHANIDRVATVARENVRQILSGTTKNVRMELDQLSQDLQQKQKTGGYVEGDLTRIRQQLMKLNDTVKRFNEQVQIDTSISKTIAWDSLLFVIPKQEKAPGAPSNMNIYNSYPQRPNPPVTTPQPQRAYSNASASTSVPQRSYSNAPTPTSIPHYMDPYRSYGRSASISSGSRPSTFQCIGCKATNPFNPNGRNICSTCRCPAPF